jgi:hypothetical protein
LAKREERNANSSTTSSATPREAAKIAALLSPTAGEGMKKYMEHWDSRHTPKDSSSSDKYPVLMDADNSKDDDDHEKMSEAPSSVACSTDYDDDDDDVPNVDPDTLANVTRFIDALHQQQQPPDSGTNNVQMLPTMSSESGASLPDTVVFDPDVLQDLGNLIDKLQQQQPSARAPAAEEPVMVASSSSEELGAEPELTQHVYSNYSETFTESTLGDVKPETLAHLVAYIDSLAKVTTPRNREIEDMEDDRVDPPFVYDRAVDVVPRVSSPPKLSASRHDSGSHLLLDDENEENQQRGNIDLRVVSTESKTTMSQLDTRVESFLLQQPSTTSSDDSPQQRMVEVVDFSNELYQQGRAMVKDSDSLKPSVHAINMATTDPCEPADPVDTPTASLWKSSIQSNNTIVNAWAAHPGTDAINLRVSGVDHFADASKLQPGLALESLEEISTTSSETKQRPQQQAPSIMNRQDVVIGSFIDRLNMVEPEPREANSATLPLFKNVVTESAATDDQDTSLILKTGIVENLANSVSTSSLHLFELDVNEKLATLNPALETPAVEPSVKTARKINDVKPSAPLSADLIITPLPVATDRGHQEEIIGAFIDSLTAAGSTNLQEGKHSFVEVEQRTLLSTSIGKDPENETPGSCIEAENGAVVPSTSSELIETNGALRDGCPSKSDSDDVDSDLVSSEREAIEIEVMTTNASEGESAHAVPINESFDPIAEARSESYRREESFAPPNDGDALPLAGVLKASSGISDGQTHMSGDTRDPSFLHHCNKISMEVEVADANGCQSTKERSDNDLMDDKSAGEQKPVVSDILVSFGTPEPSKNQGGESYTDKGLLATESSLSFEGVADIDATASESRIDLGDGTIGPIIESQGNEEFKSKEAEPNLVSELTLDEDAEESAPIIAYVKVDSIDSEELLAVRSSAGDGVFRASPFSVVEDEKKEDDSSPDDDEDDSIESIKYVQVDSFDSSKILPIPTHYHETAGSKLTVALDRFFVTDDPDGLIDAISREQSDCIGASSEQNGFIGSSSEHNDVIDAPSGQNVCTEATKSEQSGSVNALTKQDNFVEKSQSESKAMGVDFGERSEKEFDIGNNGFPDILGGQDKLIGPFDEQIQSGEGVEKPSTEVPSEQATELGEIQEEENSRGVSHEKTLASRPEWTQMLMSEQLDDGMNPGLGSSDTRVSRTSSLSRTHLHGEDLFKSSTTGSVEQQEHHLDVDDAAVDALITSHYGEDRNVDDDALETKLLPPMPHMDQFSNEDNGFSRSDEDDSFKRKTDGENECRESTEGRVALEISSDTFVNRREQFFSLNVPREDSNDVMESFDSSRAPLSKDSLLSHERSTVAEYTQNLRLVGTFAITQQHQNEESTYYEANDLFSIARESERLDLLVHSLLQVSGSDESSELIPDSVSKGYSSSGVEQRYEEEMVNGSLVVADSQAEAKDVDQGVFSSPMAIDLPQSSCTTLEEPAPASPISDTDIGFHSDVFQAANDVVESMKLADQLLLAAELSMEQKETRISLESASHEIDSDDVETDAEIVGVHRSYLRNDLAIDTEATLEHESDREREAFIISALLDKLSSPVGASEEEIEFLNDLTTIAETQCIELPRGSKDQTIDNDDVDRKVMLKQAVSPSSVGDGSTPRRTKKAFDDNSEVDKNENIVAFFRRFSALQAGGHFPDANIEALKSFAKLSNDGDEVEVDIVRGYVRKEFKPIGGGSEGSQPHPVNTTGEAPAQLLQQQPQVAISVLLDRLSSPHGASADEIDFMNEFVKVASPILEGLQPTAVEEARIRQASERAGIPSRVVDEFLDLASQRNLELRQATSSSTAGSSTPNHLTKKFDDIPEVDENENISAFLRRLASLEAGGHFPYANMEGLGSFARLSNDGDEVEIDLHRGYVRKEFEQCQNGHEDATESSKLNELNVQESISADHNCAEAKLDNSAKDADRDVELKQAVVEEARDRQLSPGVGLPLDFVGKLIDHALDRSSVLSTSRSGDGSTPKHQKKAFDDISEVDENENISAFLNRLSALKAGGHFPDLNLENIGSLLTMSSDSDAVEVDLKCGFVKKQLAEADTPMRMETLSPLSNEQFSIADGASDDGIQQLNEFFRDIAPFLKEPKPTAVEEAQIRQAAQKAGISLVIVDQLLQKSSETLDDDTFDGTNENLDENNVRHEYDVIEEVDENEAIDAFLHRFTALKQGGHFPDASIDALAPLEPENDEAVEIDVAHGFVRKELAPCLSDDEPWWQDVPTKGESIAGVNQAELSVTGVPRYESLASISLKQFAETPKEAIEISRGGRYDSAEDWDFGNGKAKPERPSNTNVKPPQAREPLDVFETIKDTSTFFRELELRTSNTDEWIKKESMANYGNPFKKSWLSRSARVGRPKPINGVAAAGALTKQSQGSSRHRTCGGPRHWKRSYKQRTRNHSGYFNVHVCSLYETSMVAHPPHALDFIPWENRDVRQRFLHEQSISFSRNWFGKCSTRI